MAGDSPLKRRRLGKERVKETSNGDADDYEVDKRPPGENTCLSTLVVATLIAGVCVLLGLMSLQSPEAQSYGGPPIYHSQPTVQQAEVVLEHTQQKEQAQEPPAQDVTKDAASSGEDSSATSVVGDLSSEGRGRNSDTAAPAADPAEPPDHHSAKPDPANHAAPAEPIFIPIDVQLEGSEPTVVQPEGVKPTAPGVGSGVVSGPGLGQQEVRVRQMIRQQTHPNGSVTEEVISEQVLQEGDEGYDDLGKEPVIVSEETMTVPEGSTGPTRTS